MKKYETWKNKVCGVALIIVGVLLMMVSVDATFLLIALCIAIPLFLAKRNWVF